MAQLLRQSRFHGGHLRSDYAGIMRAPVDERVVLRHEPGDVYSLNVMKNSDKPTAPIKASFIGP